MLIADENLRSAQLALAGSRHDGYLAEASVLDASGRLEVRSLLPSEPIYDPAHSFDRVRSAGAPPWEGLVAAADQVGAPPAPAH